MAIFDVCPDNLRSPTRYQVATDSYRRATIGVGLRAVVHPWIPAQSPDDRGAQIAGTALKTRSLRYRAGDARRSNRTNALLVQGLDFRSLEPELYDTVTQLCSLSAARTVQHRLNGRSVMLCGARVTHAFTMDGSSIPAHRNFTVRFVSRDPRVVVETLIEPKTRAFGRAVQRYQDLMSLIQKRLPELGEYLERQRFLASRQAQHTLGAGLPQSSPLFDECREANAGLTVDQQSSSEEPHDEMR
jgi:hypothetical protein